MFKLLMICVIPSLFFLNSSAQTASPDSPKELKQLIRKSEPDTNRIVLLLKLGGYYVFKPGSYKNDMDSARTLFKEAMELSNRLHDIKGHNETLKLLGDCYLEEGNLFQGKACFMKVIDYYHKIRNKKEEADLWVRFGDCISRADHQSYFQKLQCYGNAQLLFKQLHDHLNEIQAYKDIADIHLNLGNVDAAETELLQVLKMYKIIRFKNLHYTYDLLAELNSTRGRLNKMLYYRLETIKSMEATGDFSVADLFNFKLGATYFQLGVFDKSLIYYEKSLDLSRKTYHSDIFFAALQQIVRVLIIKGRPEEALNLLIKCIKEVKPKSNTQLLDADEGFASCYNALKHYSKAEKYYQLTIELGEPLYYKSEITPFNYTTYIREICKFYIAIKQFKKADFYLKKLPVLGVNRTNPVINGVIELLKFKVDSASGDYLSAIGHFQQHKKIQDSLYNTSKSKQIEELQIKYETGQKDKDILLLKKQAQLQENQVERTKLTRNVVIGGSVMLLMLLGIGYNRYRLKQRSNLQLEEKQKQITTKNTALERLLSDNEWLLREVHHRVKNNLQIVMSLLNSQSAYLQDEAALNAVMESQHRVQAMSLIHQKLYKSNNVSNIFMPDYIDDLVDYLKDSFKTGQRIYFETQIEPVNLDVLQAVPIGLILNEAITNAIKYAFSQGSDDRISIKLAKNGIDEMTLTIADNGRGLPSDFNIAQSSSFGLTLVTGLAGELGGSLNIQSSNGTTISLWFKTAQVHQSV